MSQIEQILQNYLRDTLFLSSLEQMRSTVWYSQLVQFGPAALPLLFDTLRSKRAGMNILILLSDITGTIPLESEIVGGFQATNVSALKTAWLEWAGKNGY